MVVAKIADFSDIVIDFWGPFSRGGGVHKCTFGFWGYVAGWGD